MNQYKVIGNTVPQHNFVVGSIITMRAAGLTDDTAVFELANVKNTVQVVNMNDVEPVELSQQEAVVAIAGVVDNIYRQVSEAEALADANGLTFDIDIADGISGTYCGTDRNWNASRITY